MNIERRQKYSGQGRTSVFTQKRLPINFDLASLNLMCNYILTDNRNIKRSQYINLRNLMDLLDMNKYINDQEKYKRVIFIKKGLEARLVKGLTNPVAISKYINGGILDDDIIDINSFVGMSNQEIDWINETVSNSLKSSFIYEDVDKALDLFTRFKAADYKSISILTSEIEQFIIDMNNKFRKAKVQQSTDRTFSLNPDSLRSIIQDTWSEITSPYRKIITGMQGFNQLIGGGFENTRVYLLLGLTGTGKSLTLLNIAYQLKKYNKGFKAKDPTKKPCIVYLTMENTVTETVQRLFQIATGGNMADYSVDDIINMLLTTGELYLTDESPVDLIIKFRPNRSEDTGYLYTLTEDLEDEGYEVICMIQDHVQRIRAASGNQDIRLELGDVINEMKIFAQIKDIPVITNSHLNRDGARVIDNSVGTGHNKADLTRMLGKSNVGESLLLLDNVDFACILNREFDSENNQYMVFKNIKTRIKTLRDYICQPFAPDNDIKLIEDFYSLTPVFRESLYNNTPQLVKNKSSKISQVGYSSNLKSIDDDEENIYDLSAKSVYSSNSMHSVVQEKTYVDTVGIRPEVENPHLVSPIQYIA